MPLNLVCGGCTICVQCLIIFNIISFCYFTILRDICINRATRQLLFLMAEPDGETLDSPISYARSSDFNPLFYTPITSKKMPKWWFPDVYPQYANSYHTPTSSPYQTQSPTRDVNSQDTVYVLALLTQNSTSDD